MAPSLRDRLLGRVPGPELPTEAAGNNSTNGTAPAKAVDPLEGLRSIPEAPQVIADYSTVDKLKRELHTRLVERLDLSALEKIRDEGVLVQQIRAAVLEFLRSEQAPMSAAERDSVVEQIVWEVTGLGPLEPLMRDMTVSDILVNGPRSEIGRASCRERV